VNARWGRHDERANDYQDASYGYPSDRY
jgi:hypothetical protein